MIAAHLLVKRFFLIEATLVTWHVPTELFHQICRLPHARVISGVGYTNVTWIIRYVGSVEGNRDNKKSEKNLDVSTFTGMLARCNVVLTHCVEHGWIGILLWAGK